MAAFKDRSALVEALQAGWFADGSKAETSLSPLRMAMWAQLENQHFLSEADNLEKILRQWEGEIGPLVESMLSEKDATKSSLITAILAEQYVTECRLMKG